MSQIFILLLLVLLFIILFKFNIFEEKWYRIHDWTEWMKWNGMNVKIANQTKKKLFFLSNAKKEKKYEGVLFVHMHNYDPNWKIRDGGLYLVTIRWKYYKLHTHI